MFQFSATENLDCCDFMTGLSVSYPCHIQQNWIWGRAHAPVWPAPRWNFSARVGHRGNNKNQSVLKVVRPHFKAFPFMQGPSLATVPPCGCGILSQVSRILWVWPIWAGGGGRNQIVFLYFGVKLARVSGVFFTFSRLMEKSNLGGKE